MKIKIKELDVLEKEFWYDEQGNIKTKSLIMKRHIEDVAWKTINVRKEKNAKDWVSDGVFVLHDLVKVDGSKWWHVSYDAVEYIETNWWVKLTMEDYEDLVQ